jgi:hypothetical protein
VYTGTVGFGLRTRRLTVCPAALNPGTSPKWRGETGKIALSQVTILSLALPFSPLPLGEGPGVRAAEAAVGVSAMTAGVSAMAAGVSATAAGVSATAAGVSATTAGVSAMAAGVSATTAGGSATAAGVSATTADLSATADDVPETAAELPAGTAATIRLSAARAVSPPLCG